MHHSHLGDLLEPQASPEFPIRDVCVGPENRHSHHVPGEAGAGCVRAPRPDQGSLPQRSPGWALCRQEVGPPLDSARKRPPSPTPPPAAPRTPSGHPRALMVPGEPCHQGQGHILQQVGQSPCPAQVEPRRVRKQEAFSRAWLRAATSP